MADKNDNLIKDEMSEKIISAAEALVTQVGAKEITVRQILQKLDITNRVFYNRFHNIDEVLQIVYTNTTMKVRESISGGIDDSRDFFEQVIDMLEKTLLTSYNQKKQFNHYVFEHDSLSQSNFKWWMGEIKKLIDYAKAKKHIKDVDSDKLSYSIWCFCRGFNADAVARNFSLEEAKTNFRYSFGLLFDGLKN
ncbi:MAG: TetR/AcrR family transcriptional regulator [Clostridia bacterium]|nr:TetR/AcrR family transcriptional regulator [Clostridia bacterium]